MNLAGQQNRQYTLLFTGFRPSAIWQGQFMHALLFPRAGLMAGKRCQAAAS
jgi:hypothetical protein